jgi:hypothetical protein
MRVCDLLQAPSSVLLIPRPLQGRAPALCPDGFGLDVVDLDAAEE